VIVHGPERLAGQGLDSEQHDSGNRAIHALLADGAASATRSISCSRARGDGTEHGAYEVWAHAWAWCGSAG
jgi:hypothetical protein